MNSIFRILRKAAWLLGVVAINNVISVIPSHAYTNQWEWRVVSVSRGSDNYPVPSGSFPTKQAALAAMRAVVWPPNPTGNPPGSVLTEEAGISSIGASGVRYKYTMPPSAAAIIGEWEYGTQQQYANEAQAYAAMVAAIFVCDPPAVVTLNSDWHDSPANSWYGNFDQNQVKSYRVSSECSLPQVTTRSLYRERTYHCPQWYNQTTTFGECAASPIVGYIDGHPIECAATGAASKVGNPCDVTNGDKSQTETDYQSTGLNFSRYYHSANLESAQRLGMGWTHDFAARLILSSNGLTPLGLLRPSGHHEILTQTSGRYIARSGGGIEVVKIGTEWMTLIGDGSKEAYDATGKLTRLIDRSGLATNLLYTNGALSSVVGPFGHSLQFSYEAGRISQFADPAGQITYFDYDSDANLSQVTYPGGTIRVYVYEDANFPNHLTGIIDESGTRFSTYSYDSLGRVQTSQHAGSAGLVSLAYSAGNTLVTDALGGVTTYTFDANVSHTRRITSASKNGLTTTYAVPSPGTEFQRRVTQTTDPRGLVTRYNYDLSHLTSAIEAWGTPSERTQSYQYLSTEDDLVTYEGLSSVESGGIVREILTSYNTQRLPQTVTHRGYGPGGSSTDRVTTYSYYSDGRLATVDGPRTDVNDVTTYNYYTCTTGYECGQLQTATNPLGHVTSYLTYNAHGQPLTMTDPNGVSITMTYDLRQRLTSRSVGGETTSFTYWPTGLLRRVTQPDASFVEFSYDAAHRLVRMTDTEGSYLQYTLDAMGNRTAENVYDVGGGSPIRSLTRTYNTLNQLATEVGAAGTPAVTTSFGYDDNGNQTGINAPLGRNTAELYDELNRLTQVTDPESGVIQHVYDALDRITSVTDPEGLTTTYQYNGLGDLLQQTSPDTGVTTYTYDSAGNIATKTDARGSPLGYSVMSYDALNRVTQQQYSDRMVIYGYDSCLNGIGRLCSMGDAKSLTTYEYDAQGRVIRKRQTVYLDPGWFGTQIREVRYWYVNGRLTQMQMPDGLLVGYTHDVQGRVTAMTWYGQPVLSNVLYDPFGGIRGWTWANGTLMVREYDQDGRIDLIDSAGLMDLSYDDAGRITGIASDGSYQAWTHGYDLNDRLTASTRTGLSRGYSYDANGNRLSQSGTQSASYSYSNPFTSHRIGNITGGTPRTYTYDAMGNVTSNGYTTYTYNGAGRLATIPGVPYQSSGSTFHYNGVNQRIHTWNGSGNETTYLYDESGHLLEKCVAWFGNECLDWDSQQYVWLGDIPVATRLKTVAYNWEGYIDYMYVELFNVHTDQLNTPRKLTRANSSNDLVWRWDPDGFGVGQPNGNVAGGDHHYAFDLRFPGQFWDGSTGLHQNWHRDYDPVTGRYYQSDPIGLHGGLNTYLYASANPLSYIDPFGLLPVCDTIQVDLTRNRWTETTHKSYFQIPAIQMYPGSVGVGSQPSLKLPRRPPIGPNVRYEIWFVYLQFRRDINTTYEQFIQHMVNFCKDTIADECGQEREITLEPSYFDIKHDPNKVNVTETEVYLFTEMVRRLGET